MLKQKQSQILVIFSTYLAEKLALIHRMNTQFLQKLFISNVGDVL